MISQAYKKSISIIIIQLYSKTLSATWKVLENKKIHVELESLPLQHLLSHNSIAERFTKKKRKQYCHDHAAYDYNRQYTSRWSVTTLRMT